MFLVIVSYFLACLVLLVDGQTLCWEVAKILDDEDLSREFTISSARQAELGLITLIHSRYRVNSLQSCLTLCDPMDCSLPGSSVHGILQAEVGCHALLQGIFPTQGLNPRILCLLHWQAGSLPLAPGDAAVLLKLFLHHSHLRAQAAVVVQSLIPVLLCDPTDCSTPGFPVLHDLLDLAQIHVRWVDDAIQPSHPLSPPFPPALKLRPSISVFSSELVLGIRWPKYWSFSFDISPSISIQHWIPSQISINFIDWFHLLAVQGTLKSLLQHHNLKASILQCPAFFMVQLSHVYMTTGKTIASTIWTVVSKVTSLLLICFLGLS